MAAAPQSGLGSPVSLFANFLTCPPTCLPSITPGGSPSGTTFPAAGRVRPAGGPGSGGDEGVGAGAPPAWSPRAAGARGAECAERGAGFPPLSPGRQLTSAHQFEALGFPASFPLRELHGAGKVAARQETEAAAEAGSCHRRGAAGTKVRVAIGGGGRGTGGTTASPAGGCAPGAKLSPRAAPPPRCLRRPLGAPSCRLALSRTQPAAAQLSVGSGAGLGRGAVGCSPRPAWAQPADAARGTRRAEGGRRRRVRSGGRGADRPRGRRGRAGEGGGAAGTPGPPAGGARPPPSPGGRRHCWTRPCGDPAWAGGRAVQRPERPGPVELPPRTDAALCPASLCGSRRRTCL